MAIRYTYAQASMFARMMAQQDGRRWYVLEFEPGQCVFQDYVERHQVPYLIEEWHP